jgi:hypothetical protein
MATVVFKTSPSQIKATRKYIKNNPEKHKTICKKYYDVNADELKRKKREKYAKLSPEEKKLKRKDEYAKAKIKRDSAKLLAKQKTIVKEKLD